MNNIQSELRQWKLSEILSQLEVNTASFINECCQNYHRHIDETADKIVKDPNHKIIMMAGPSGSGKTTTAGYLRQSLAKRGVQSAVVSLDDFYLGRHKAPLLPNGEYDYESVHALNVPLLQECLLQLVEKGYCNLPKFDFMTSKPSTVTVPMQLKDGDLIIFEGIHALNSLILDCLPADCITKIYVSVETTVYNHEGILLSPREIRLARRLVRDSIYRNADACRTLQMWTGVVMGEDKYLFPFKNTVDYSLSTFHEFEPAILLPYLLPLLQALPDGTPNAELARDLLKNYQQFPSLSTDQLPEDCLLHEFVG